MWKTVTNPNDVSPAQSALDLRRRVRSDLARLIARRAAALEPADRTLVCSVFELGRPVAEVGRLLGQADARSLRKRLRRLSARVLTPEYAFVIGHRDRWPPLRRAVATERFIHGRSFREIARHNGLSYYSVRMHTRAVEELVRGAAGGAG
ncbi:MAG: hypothetical protein IT437_01600 [Phycisphaerales bacterium]|nr:hypothetical protein [Phycisphaerales bacterium]